MSSYAPCFPERRYTVILFETLRSLRHLLGESVRHSLHDAFRYAHVTWPRTPVCIASVIHYIVHSIIVTVTSNTPIRFVHSIWHAFRIVALRFPSTRTSLTRSCVNHCPTPSNTCVQSSFIPSVSPSLHQFLMIAWLAPICIPSRTPSLTMSVTPSLSPSRPITHSVNRHVPGFSLLRLRIAVARRCTFHHEKISFTVSLTR